jgi:hypothetical protein
MGAGRCTTRFHPLVAALLVTAIVVTASPAWWTARSAGTPAAATPSGTPAATRDETRIRAAIEAVLDPETHRGAIRLPGVRLDPTGDLTVVFALRAAPTLDAVRTAGIADVLTILRAVYDPLVSSRVRTTTVIGTFSETSERGARELRVLRVVLSAARAATIDWATVTPDELATRSDAWRIYPVLGDPGLDRPGDEATPTLGTPTA